jgi:phosphoglucosamine mutase
VIRREGADVGFAFDGDGDRVLAVDGEGRPFDGDEIVALAALHLAEVGELPGGVAVTVMTNYGFHTAMRDAGIEVATTKVGDRFVIEELVERGWTIGGEQSGHIIWTDFAATGDGLAAALLVTRALGDRKLAEVRPIEKLPQYLQNVRIPSREALDGATALWEAVGREGAGLEGRGRVLVRPSGTEPLIRVMVEAPDEEECEQVLARLVEAAEQALA